jgi:hypothetical protein
MRQFGNPLQMQPQRVPGTFLVPAVREVGCGIRACHDMT